MDNNDMELSLLDMVHIELSIDSYISNLFEIRKNTCSKTLYNIISKEIDSFISLHDKIHSYNMNCLIDDSNK